MESVDVDDRLVIDPTSRLTAASPDEIEDPPEETVEVHIPRQSSGQPAAEEVAAGDALSERDREILAFERQWWKHAGAKEQAIRDTFGLSTTRYYRLLNALLDNPAALAYDALLVQRLRRLRATRSRSRTGGRR